MWGEISHLRFKINKLKKKKLKRLIRTRAFKYKSFK